MHRSILPPAALARAGTIVALVIVAVVLLAATTKDQALAASPGKNGLIGYVKGGPACPATECGYALWVSALDGTRARLLKSTKTTVVGIQHPAWSPDGKTIAYFDYTFQRKTELRPSWYQLWIIKADGSGRKLLIKSPETTNRPSWVNAHEVAYQSQSALMAIDIRTMRTRKIATLPKMAGAAQFSPDGKHIAYTDANGILYVMSPTGAGKTRLAPIIRWPYNDNFDWSPDSRKLVVLVEGETPAIVSIAGETGPPLVEGQDRWRRPIWSPDGSTILSQREYVAEPDPTRPGRWRSRFVFDNFTSIQPDGSGIATVGPGVGACKTRVPRRPCEVRDPSWQPLH